MKVFNYIRGFFSRNRAVLPAVWDFYRQAMSVSGPYKGPRAVTCSVWRTKNHELRSSSVTASVPRMPNINF